MEGKFINFKLRLSDLNLIVGMGWRHPDNAFVVFSFANDIEGPSVTASIKEWSVSLPLDELWQERKCRFWLGDLRKLIVAIADKYLNVDANLTFNVGLHEWEVVGGPGNGIILDKQF